jgi:hypothetical protein
MPVLSQAIYCFDSIAGQTFHAGHMSAVLQKSQYPESDMGLE